MDQILPQRALRKDGAILTQTVHPTGALSGDHGMAQRETAEGREFMDKPKISVVIPSRNRAEVLERALESLTRQTLGQEMFEVIVVDNGSTDHTPEICAAFRQRFKHFQALLEPEPGLHRGRHAGLKASRAEILTYADDDIEAFDSWLTGVWEAFQDPRVGLVGGKNLPKFEQSPPHWLWQKWVAEGVRWGRRMGALSLIDFGDTIQEIDPYYVYGCNFSVRKKVILDAGGFHPDGMPSELIAFRGDGESYISGYVQSNGLKALYHPQASVFHWVPTSRMCRDYFQKRSFNQGVSDSFAAVRYAGKPFEPKEPTLWQKLYKKIVHQHLLRRDVSRLAEELGKGEFQRDVEASYKAGFEFHQQECRRNPLVLNWVLQESFLD